MRGPTLPKVLPFHITRLQLEGYEAGEVAHIENVMEGETRDRRHRRLRQTETTFVAEEEVTNEQERDLQTTERFEIENEVEALFKDEERFSAGVSLTASYGFVSLSGQTEYAASTTEEQSQRAADKYVKEIIDRATSRLKSRIKTVRTTRALSEVEERNKHAFVNDGTDHIVGVYRWVDKYYLAKRFDLGKRMVFDFHVTEPAAFYLFGKMEAAASGDIPVEPTAPYAPARPGVPLDPAQINEYNYLAIAQQVNAEGLAPPPPERVVLAHAVSRELEPEQSFSFDDEDIVVPKGYVARRGWARSMMRAFRDFTLYPGGAIGYRPINYPEHPTYARFMVGTMAMMHQTSTHFWDGPWDHSHHWFDLSGEENSVPVSATGIGVASFALHIEVEFERKPETYTQWQLSTYQAIMAAYQKARVDYEEELASAGVAGGVSISGRNPESNRRVEQTELRKLFMMLLTDTELHFGPFLTHDETLSPPDDYPEIIRPVVPIASYQLEFLEGAFEWENMTYEFLPYYWGRKERWIEMTGREDVDPIFEKFLQAGQARVVVPIRPGFEEDVLFYQLTGVIWPRIAGPVPTLPRSGSWLYDYVGDLLTELEAAESLTAPEGEIEIRADDEDVIRIKVPTDLVWLQPSNELPTP